MTIIRRGEGISPEAQPFYRAMMEQLACGHSIAAMLATAEGADTPGVTLFTYDDERPEAHAFATHPNPSVRCAFAVAGQIMARGKAEEQGYEIAVP